MTFTVANATTKPKAGYWQDPKGVDFYVAGNQANVTDFALYITVPGCGSYRIPHSAAIPIAQKKFSFTGAFYGNGTFDSVTTAHGTCGLDNYYVDWCVGYVSAGPGTGQLPGKMRLNLPHDRGKY